MKTFVFIIAILVPGLLYAANAKTLADIHRAHANGKVRILLVPGHEPDYGGAEYFDLKERDLVLPFAEHLRKFLAANKNYEVIVSRNSKGWWPEMEKYFIEKWDEIALWKTDMRALALNIVPVDNASSTVPKVFHNNASPEVAMRLYGLNKWGNENSVDIAIHIHFNDYPQHTKKEPGIYSGFTVYIPAAKYGNNTTSKAVAATILNRLKKYTPISDLPGESIGIVEDEELIAIGVSNTANFASMLIEYGYIYEPQIVNKKTRDAYMKDLAWQTFQGVQDFFDPRNISRVRGSYDTTVIPYKWTKTFAGKKSPVMDVFALQTALTLEGMYPPKGKTKNECPRSGIMGPCTEEALKAFQAKYGVKKENGKVGKKTLKVLNHLY